MPITMKKIYHIAGDYTPEQLSTIKELIDEFRLRMADDNIEKNLLNCKKEYYTDNEIVSLLKVGLSDLNGGSPRTNYTLFNADAAIGNDLIVLSAMIFALMREGILQLRNQIDYSDSGLTIAMFNKTGAYQGWANFMLQMYMREKSEFKSSVIPNSANSGFVGITSEFGYGRWY